MASSQNVERPLPEDELENPASRKKGEMHQDVEVGPEIVDIERIEKVYGWVEHPLQFAYSSH